MQLKRFFTQYKLVSPLKTYLLIFLLSILGFEARPGDFKGNGADVVVCPAQSPQLLDFYELKYIDHASPQLGDQQLPIAEKLAIYLERLKNISPLRGSQFENLAQQFIKESVFLVGISLEDIPDSGHEIVIPSDCKLLQIVNQNPMLLPPGKRYAIDYDLWQSLDADNQVGLIFHELIFSQSNARYSKGIRELNRALVIDLLRTATTQKRVEYFQKAELAWLDLQGVVINLNLPIVYSPTGNVLGATPIARSSTIVNNQTITLMDDPIQFYHIGNIKSVRLWGSYKYVQKTINFDFVTDHYSNQEHLSFFENGKVLTGYFALHKELKSEEDPLQGHYYGVTFDAEENVISFLTFSGHYRFHDQFLPIKSNSTVHLYASPASKPTLIRVKAFILDYDTTLNFPNQNVSILKDSELSFDETGKLRRFTLSKTCYLLTKDGQQVIRNKGDQVVLDENEYLEP